jgi:Conserved TM helix
MNQLSTIHGAWSGAVTHPVQALGTASAMLAQTTARPASGGGDVNQLINTLGPNLLSTVQNVVGALLIFIIGWLVAGFVSTLVTKLLSKSGVEGRLTNMMSSGRRGGSSLNISQLLGTIIYWVIIILALVAALNVLNLTTVSKPLTDFLSQIFLFLPRLGAAAALAAVAWVVATLARTFVSRMSQSYALDDKLGSSELGNAYLLSDTLGNALYWFVLLFFLPLILGVLELQGPLAPVQNMLNEFLLALPRIFKAVIIGGVGWLLARIVREIITNLLAATGADQLGAQVGLSPSKGSQSLSWIAGTVAFVFILIPAVIGALDALQIPALSAPATSMLKQVLDSIPKLFTAGLILAVSYVIGKFLADLVANLLAGFGFDNIFSWLGITLPKNTREAGEPMLINEASLTSAAPRTPSEIMGVVVLIGTMLLAAITAIDVLGLPALQEVVKGLLAISAQILIGVVVFAVGLYLANLASRLILSSGSSQANILAQTARISILAFAGAMALDRMGIATSIVNLAFGLLLGAIAVAIAIAFGLGGRDVASEYLRDWSKSFKR